MTRRGGRALHVARRVAAAAVVAGGYAVRAHAQEESAAKAIRLQIRPNVGDTLHMRLDQRVEMVGTTRVAGADSTRGMVSLLTVATSVVVEGRDSAGTVLSATTDSVSLAHNGPDSAQAAERARRQYNGRRVRLHVSPDGVTAMLGSDGPVRPEVRQLFAQMPATFPAKDVSVGARWVRAMLVPLSGDARVSINGTLKATFRLDSLGHGGDLAYVSMSGRLSRDDLPSISYGGLNTLEMAGEMSGAFVIDRRRGWIMAARTTMIVLSVFGSSAAPQTIPPIRTKMTVTQRLRAW
jgi:uncharacterized protein DUF6263